MNKNEAEAIASLKNCLVDTKNWFVANNFKVNDGKNQLMYFSPRKEFNPSFHLSLGPVLVEPSSSVKSLGIIFDSKMSMEQRTNAVARSIYFHV